jgi:nucleoside-triphosphatase
MTTKILLTGRPGCGKTTLIRKVLDQYPGRAGGFTTRELRESGFRTGFEVHTLDGQRGLLAHVAIRSPEKVGKYGVDLSFLEKKGIPQIELAVRRGYLVVIDELGPMEFKSSRFRQVVITTLNEDVPLLGSIVARPDPFGDLIKGRADVSLVKVREDNRETLVDLILQRLEP